MRNHRLFGVVTAVLLGMGALHISPSSPHHDHLRIAGSHLGGAAVQLASATVSAGHEPTPSSLGQLSPIGLLRPAASERALVLVALMSSPKPSVSAQASLAEGDEMHIGQLRPAGTRFVKMLVAWVSYRQAHAPPPPVPKPAPPAPVVHVAAPVTRAVEPATSAAGGAAGGAALGGVWARLRQCESGGNYGENTGNGYYGAYQFAAGTWHGLGYPGLPSAAAPAVQDQAAQRLQARSGWGQWPACSRRLGLL